jgi:hypothetical protein
MGFTLLMSLRRDRGSSSFPWHRPFIHPPVLKRSVRKGATRLPFLCFPLRPQPLSTLLQISSKDAVEITQWNLPSPRRTC